MGIKSKHDTPTKLNGRPDWRPDLREVHRIEDIPQADAKRLLELEAQAAEKRLVTKAKQKLVLPLNEPARVEAAAVAVGTSLKSTLLAITGLGGVTYYALNGGVEPSVLVLFCVMMGFPAYLVPPREQGANSTPD